MTRVWLAGLLAVGLLLTAVAVGLAGNATAAAPPGAGAGAGWWSRVDPQTDAERAYVAEVTRLHQEIRDRQCQLLDLRAGNAGAKAIAGKQAEIDALRDRLHDLNLRNRELHQRLMQDLPRARGQRVGAGPGGQGRGSCARWGGARQGQGLCDPKRERARSRDRAGKSAALCTPQRDRKHDRRRDRIDQIAFVCAGDCDQDRQRDPDRIRDRYRIDQSAALCAGDCDQDRERQRDPDRIRDRYHQQAA
jgi:hypothetical protein